MWKPEAMTLLLAGVGLCWVAGSLLSATLGPLLQPRSPELLRLYQFLLATLSLHGVTLVLANSFLRVHEVTWGEFLGLRQAGVRRALLVGLLASAVMIPGALALNKGSAWVLQQMEVHAPEQPTVKILQGTVGWGERLAFGIGAIVLAPFVEEILFRGLAFSFLRQVGSRRLAYGVSAVAFAAIHMNLVTFLPLVFIGLVLARVYEQTGRLAAAIVTHALFNGVNFMILLYHAELERLFDLLRDRI